jgi:hypothetical protein
MATFKTFEEIEAWKKARELTKRVYAVSGVGPSPRISASRTRFGVHLSRSCPISPKVMTEVEAGSSYSFLR